MTKIISGDRIGRSAQLRTGCSAAIFDADRKKVLLTRRTDNGQWCLPGGAMEPGESAAEACERETWEETGLQGRVKRLLGIYSSPDWLIEYPDGHRFQIVALNFEVEICGGELRTTDETTAFGYFSPAEIEALDLIPHHRQRIHDIFSDLDWPVVD